MFQVKIYTKHIKMKIFKLRRIHTFTHRHLVEPHPAAICDFLQNVEQVLCSNLTEMKSYPETAVSVPNLDLLKPRAIKLY